MAVNRWQGGGEGVEKQRSREDTRKLTHFAGWLKRIIISTGTPPRARSETAQGRLDALLAAAGVRPRLVRLLEGGR